MEDRPLLRGVRAVRKGWKPVKPGDYVCTAPLITPRSEGLVLALAYFNRTNSTGFKVLWHKGNRKLTVSIEADYDLWLLFPC